MAVQKNKVTRSKRNMRRAHDNLAGPTLSTDKTTGEVHRRHHITADGFYKGEESTRPRRRVSLGLPIKISIDAMGGDFGPEVTVPAAVSVLSKHPDLHTVLVGDQERIETVLASAESGIRPRLQIEHTEVLVRDEDLPTRILREKTDSSMSIAVKLVQGGDVHACVSAGNTGALLLAGAPSVENDPRYPEACHHGDHTRGKSKLLSLGRRCKCRLSGRTAIPICSDGRSIGRIA